jgi:hypothetical protein
MLARQRFEFDIYNQFHLFKYRTKGAYSQALIDSKALLSTQFACAKYGWSLRAIFLMKFVFQIRECRANLPTSKQHFISRFKMHDKRDFHASGNCFGINLSSVGSMTDTIYT